MAFPEYSGMLSPRVSVVIPALNEARNLPHVFPRIPADVHEVILVDGGSVDGTARTARKLRPDVHVVVQRRRSKWNALARGFAEATGDIVAILDGDGSADPAAIPRFVTALLSGAEFAKGTRFAAGCDRSDVTRLRRLGNRMLSGLVNVLCGTQYSDLCYGLSAVWRRHLPVLGLDAALAGRAGGGRSCRDGYATGARILIRVAAARLVVAELPSFDPPRIPVIGNLDALGAGVGMLRAILVEHRRARRRRPPPSSSSAVHRPGEAVHRPGEDESFT